MTSDAMGNGKTSDDQGMLTKAVLPTTYYTYFITDESLALTDLYLNLQKASNLPTTEEELAFLNELLQSKELNALVTIHNKILGNVEHRRFVFNFSTIMFVNVVLFLRYFPIPVLSDGMQVLADVLELLLQQSHRSQDCQELFMTLQRPHLQVCTYIGYECSTIKKVVGFVVCS